MRPIRRGRRGLLSAPLALLLAFGCGAPGASPAPSELVVMTHASFAVSEQLLALFEAQHSVKVNVLRSGDAGSMVNQAILTRDAPLADVLFGVDNTFLSRALGAGIFEAYRPSLLDRVPAELKLDAGGRVTPIDYGDVCVNYDRSAFSDELPPPQTLDELADPRYRGMLVVQNPATSSPGLAFLLATIVRFGDEEGGGWHEYWRALRDNDVLVTSGWDDAYYGQFSGGAGEGDRPLVVSYATSPAAEVYYAEGPLEEAPTGVLTDGCFRQVEFAGALAGARNPILARRFIDFMLSREFQEDIPVSMWVFPASTAARLPDVFAQHAVRIDLPLTMAPEQIDEQREPAIREWTDVVLR